MRLIESGASLPRRNEAAVRPESQPQALSCADRSLPLYHAGTAVGLVDATDRAVWDHAKANGFTLVSLDSDFAEMAPLSGPPPKVIWLRCGNQSTAAVESLRRSHAAVIAGFEQEAGTARLEIC